MCVNSCVGFTGPFADLDKCPKCNEQRFEDSLPGKPRKPRQQFLTNPIGPQIQAAWCSPESATAMKYCQQRTRTVLKDLQTNGNRVLELDDWIHGAEYIEAVRRGDITDDSTTLMLSLNGAQLYRNKQSDCWMYIWVLLDRSSDSRYKKRQVLIRGVIPGSNKPKNVDSYLFPGFQHIAALMREGLKIWDASTDRLFLSKLFVLFLTADGPGMQFINGLVGHSGRFGCRLYCSMRGHHKPGLGHYFPICLHPQGDYNVAGSMHDDINVRKFIGRQPQDEAANRYRANLRYLQESTMISMYKERRLETGIAKPSIVSGFPRGCTFSLPNCFPGDIMHLAVLNLTDLYTHHWRGSLACEAPDNKDLWDWAVFRNLRAWRTHGQHVASATPCLPGSFDRPPRNSAEKISSGYKAVEFLTYVYGLAPALLYGVLPMKYWRNFCKLVRGIRLMYQHHITAKQLAEAHKLLIEFVEEYEQLYYGREGARIHFVRQSIHALIHTSPETFRIGPYGILAQWTMERAIGNLGKEIRQPSNPFANLAQRALRRCQTNAIKHMFPAVEPEPASLPRGAYPLENKYALLYKCERKASVLPAAEARAVREFVSAEGIQMREDWHNQPTLTRWARLRLPTGQTAHSAWVEEPKET
ncbi:hypothetical protein PsYK624_168830 [Phanerochaete sordida]|uniref:Uncharacterized protein n=1 Tax=Phanerochaete sordida TaxID=48140 RepID=A0A9P3GTX3_9APHY|nr:hypothetical protein PsYK624_168830 [Phanerochaete sordida]